MSDEEYFGALPIGCELHEYVIDGVLGQGGFGITYLAHDKNLRKKVAIKEYLPETFAIRQSTFDITAKPSCREDFDWGLSRFLQEAQTLGQFEHPNIVPVMRFFRANGTAYMVMNYQDGESLRAILDESDQLEESELEEILYPLLDGLNRVHNEGILHRDIKPGNVFIRIDGTPVLLDFGAARQAIGARGKNVTRIVTPNYAPHEQYYSDGNLGPWTDIYALASVIYEGVAGTPPPEAPARIVSDTMTPAAEAGEGEYHKDFLEAIDWALAVNIEDRPQTVAEWCDKLPRAALNMGPLHTIPAAVRSRVAPGGATPEDAVSKKSGEPRSRPERSSQERRSARTGAPDPGARTAIADAAHGNRRRARATTARVNGDTTVPSAGRGSNRLKWIAAALVFLLMGGFGVLALQFTGVATRASNPLRDMGDIAVLADQQQIENAFKQTARRVIKAKPKPVDNPDIRSLFTGAYVYARHKERAGLVQWIFRPGGRLTGAYNSSTNDPNANDSGVWRVRGNQLCMRWNHWYGGKMNCQTIKIRGAGGKKFVSTRSWTGTLRK